MFNRIITQDCTFIAWRNERLQEIAILAEREPAQAPKKLPFTFNDLPFELVDEGRGVVLITIGVIA